MSEFTESIRISVPPRAVWSVLANIGSICEWNPGVKHSEQTSSGDVGVGATRHCDLGGKDYVDEQIVVFEPYERMTIRITESNLPFASADIHFTLAPDEGGTIVMVSVDYELKFGAIGRVLDTMMVRDRYRKGMRGLLRGLKAHLEPGRAG